MTTLKEIAGMIDHSLLHPTLTDGELILGCELARKLSVASVCIKPYAVKMAKEILTGSGVKVGTVVGFPHGNSTVETKVFETRQAICDGAEEVDMVVNIGKVLSGDFEYIFHEISAIVTITKLNKVILKVIFENDFLNDDNLKIKLCEICSTLKVDFVKTSTGYGYKRMPDGSFKTEGSVDKDLIIMREHSSPEVQVKAAGGIRTLSDLLRVKDLGVTRVGASATESILKEFSEMSNLGKK
jgi:deoxyribose-phosphate aldolase